jgi:DNA polymerase-1
MMSDNSSGLGNVQLHLVDSVQKAGEFLTWLSERRPNSAIAIDTETGERAGGPRADALSPWHGQLRLVQVGDGEQGWAIPWDAWKGVFYEFGKKFDGPIVCHNIAFEAKWFDIQSEWDMPWHRAHDTMIMAHLIDPLGQGGLKPLTAKYVDRMAAQLQRVLDEGLVTNGWTWGTVPINYEPYWSYGALDTVLTMRLFDKFYPLCGPDGAYSTPYEIEMQTRKIVTRMELNGARVDLAYSQKKYDELVGYTEEVKSWMQKTYNTSITSNIQLVRLFERLGGVITEFTKSGSQSVNSDQLDKFVRDGSTEVQYLAETVLKQRKADKLASSYFLNFLDKNIDGLVHPSVKTLGARTGRMSITDPALQTLPSGDATVRRAFIPKEEGWSIISSDLDQVEFRLTANMSEDPQLISLFHEADATGGDVFTSIMRQVYQDDSLQKSDPRRRLIKGTVYGKLYGAGVSKMALTAGVQDHQMQSVVDAFDSTYPGVKRLQKAIENAGMRRLQSDHQGYVVTKTGRRLPCDDDRVYTLTNYLVQASAAEVFKMNLIKLDQADLTEYMIVPVHDEIVMQCPDSEVKEVMATVQECMTTREGWNVPLTAGVDGPFKTWGEKYDGDH